jgi:hypothetical protein
MSEISKHSPHLSFSQRNGYKPIPQPLNLEELTPRFRNELDAAVQKALDESAVCYRQGDECYKMLGVANWNKVLHQYSVSKFGLRYDEFNLGQFLLFNFLPIIAAGSFHDVMELIEDLLNLVGDEQPSFPKIVSDIFQQHQAPYIVKKIETGKWWIIQTGTPYEQQQILSAFDSLQDPSLKHTKDHLEKSGYELAKGNYSQGAEECLKALEACARFISGLFNKTGGEALKACNKIYEIPFPLYKMAENIWSYRNDAPGIGHAVKDGKLTPPTRWDAQLIYVACCGIISYLINRKNSEGH